MSGNFHETLREEKLELPSDRSTGLVFTLAALVAAYLGRGQTFVLWPALGLAVAFLGLSLLSPDRLRPLNVAWMRLAALLSRFVSPVIMLVLFLVTIVPFGLVMQLLRDPLRRRTKGAASYWIERDHATAGPPSDMRNQF